MKILLTLLLLCFLYSANAQSWFVHNPVWNDDLYNSAGWGYAKYFVEKDTTVNGVSCKKIGENSAMGSFWDSTQYGHWRYFMHEENGVVYLFDEDNNNFDTLYDFNAPVGGRWGINTYCYDDSLAYMEVLSKGYSFINNTNLQWLCIQYHNLAWGGDCCTDTIFDKMGSKRGGLLLQGMGCQFNYTSFCSYQDDSIGLYPPNALYCDTTFISSTTSLSTSAETEVFPNPVHDFLHVENNSPFEGRMEIIDATGRIALSKDSIPSVINVSALENGMYLAIIRYDSSIKILRFIKI